MTLGYESKELEKIRKLAWVAWERKTEEGEELKAEEDKGGFEVNNHCKVWIETTPFHRPYFVH